MDLLLFLNQSQFAENRNINSFCGTDWNIVYKEAVFQAVIGIVAHEIPESVLLDDP